MRTIGYVFTALLLFGDAVRADQGWQDNQDGNGFVCYDVGSFSANNLASPLTTPVTALPSGQMVLGVPTVSNWLYTPSFGANPRWFAVDGTNGNDNNQGWSDVSQAAAGAIAFKTISKLLTALPVYGAGRAVRAAIRSGAYSATADQFLTFEGLVGYGNPSLNSLLIIGTDTVSTAGATAFAGDLNDSVASGFKIATGTNAGGYNVTSYSTAGAVYTATVQLAGGGAPSFSAPPAMPYGCRIRFDNATVTSALRNTMSGVIMESGGNVLTLSAPLAASPAAGDVFYIEMPGVTGPTATFMSHFGDPSTSFSPYTQIVGVNFGALAVADSSVWLTGDEASALGATGSEIELGAAIIDFSATFDGRDRGISIRTGATTITGGRFIAEEMATTSNTATVIDQTYDTLVEKSGFASTVVLYGGAQATSNNIPFSFGSNSSTIHGSPVQIWGVSGSPPQGVLATGLSVQGGYNIGRVAFSGIGANPAIRVSGTGVGVTIQGATGTTSDVGVDLSPFGISGNTTGCLGCSVSIVNGGPPSVTGSNGDIRLADGTIVTWAQAQAGIDDAQWNRLIGTGTTSPLTILPAGTTVASLAGSGTSCVQASSTGLVSRTGSACGTGAGLFYQTIDNAGSAVTQRSAWNASTGLTSVDNGGATRTDVTANLSTGVSGGQTAIGGTATTDSLTLKATSATPTAGAQINFQNGTNFFDATTDALTISGSAPSSFTSSSTSSQALVIHSPNSSNAPTVNTGTLRIDQTGTDQPGITFTKGGTLAGAMRVNTAGTYEIYGRGVTFYGSQSSQTNSVVTDGGRIAINGSSGSNAAASNGSIEVRDNGNQTALALTRSGSGSLQDILRSNTGGTGSITLQIGTAENDGMALVTNGTAGGTAGRRVIIDGAGNVAMSTSPATTATDGFLFPTATLGPPTGSVTAKTGAAAVDVDVTNNRLYAYNSGWKIYGQSTALLATGPLCNTTSTGVDYACVAGTDYQVPLTACTDYVSLTCVTGATDLGGTNATPTVIGIEDAGKARGYIDWTARTVPANPAGTVTREYNSLFGAGLVTLDSSGNARYMVPDHTCGASNWVSSSGSGTLACTQPAFSDLSGSATCAQLPAFGGDLTSAGGTCSVQVQAIEETSGPARLAINAIPDLGSGNPAILNRPGGTGTVVGTSSVSLYGGPQGGSVSTNYVAYAPGVIGYGNWAIPYATHRTTADVQNAAMEVPVGFAAKKQRVLAWVTSNSLGSGGGGSSVTACQSTQNGVGTSVFAGGGGGIPNTSTGLFDSGITAVSSSAATDTWGLSCGGTSPLGGTINMTVTVVLYQ